MSRHKRLTSVQTPSLADRATEELRRAIRSGALVPGDRLVERQLVETLGISHIPIREALSRLADEGLVDRIPRQGARVAGLKQVEIEELSSLRTVLEEYVAEQVQLRMNSEVERQLGRLVQQMGTAADRGDVERVLLYDQRFHAALWSHCGNKLLFETVAQLRGRIDEIGRAHV